LAVRIQLHSVVDPSAADLLGARLPHAVGSNWRRAAVGGLPDDRSGDRLFGGVPWAVGSLARTIEISIAPLQAGP
jgi:hypothetical protein